MFVIVQTGDPLPLAQKFGSFADWFISGLHIDQHDVLVVDVHKNQSLPQAPLSALSGVVITGSASMVTEQSQWMKQTQNWLEQAITAGTAVLGVCFGHQLLADLLGGQVAFNQAGRHMGLARCELTAAGVEDDLLGPLQPHINTLVSHQQVVTQLPESAVRLGTTAADLNHAFRWGDRVWGLQFHPEWRPEIMSAYINERATDLRHEGFDPDAMQRDLLPCHEASSILARFAELAKTFQRD
ncbi:glutamine amidotransferase [Marinicella sediminis]|uniref:Glutamine amidotransferase n=1 Tax=Marinicella sediminis TaxID=1792834 RepID=A0ABV7JAX7_9GAMM|nr:glutamine amidotransferase [Marinicella sediminis]